MFSTLRSAGRVASTWRSAIVRPSLIIAGRVPLVASRAYHEKVIDHYERPRNVGSLDKKDANVGSGLVGAPACGDGKSTDQDRGLGHFGRNTSADLAVHLLTVMKLQIKVDENGIISDVRFKTFGCGSAIASSSYMTERVKGMTLDQAGAIKNTEIAKELCLPPVKLHCSMLAEDAIKAAIADFRQKKEQASARKIDVSSFGAKNAQAQASTSA